MRRLRIACAVAAWGATGLAPGAALASPPEPKRSFYQGFYVGGGLGAANGADVDEAQLRAPFEAQGIPIQIVDDEDGWSLAGHAFLGYQVIPYFAIEGAYTGLGSYDFEAQPTADPGRFTAELSPRFWSVSGLLTTPAWNGLSAFGKVGAAFWKADLDVSDQLGFGLLARGDDASGTSLLWGFGVRFDFTQHVGFRAEWERIENVGEREATGRSDYDAVLGSVVLSF